MLSALKTTDILFITAFLYLLQKLFRSTFQRNNTTPLQGPKPPSRLAGWSATIIRSNDAAPMYMKWAEEYGGAFVVPMSMGRKRIVLFDPMAIAHFYSRETFTYRNTNFAKHAISNLLGKGLLWAEAEDHRRQRKILSPAFSPSSVREITGVFFDSAYKAKAAWDTMFDNSSEKELVIDVQKWMNNISLDSIGIAGFSHDFASLAGANSPVEQAFIAIGKVSTPMNASKASKSSPTSISKDSSGSTTFALVTFLLPIILGPMLPFLANLPNERNRLIGKMSKVIGEIGEGLLERSRRERDSGGGGKDRSLVGTLLRAENTDSDNSLSQTEVKSQLKTLIFAGYETSSISLTWLLIELAAQPSKQSRLREELLSLPSTSDLTYDQMWSPTTAPYLDAVVKESLRLHAPLPETTRVCDSDDTVPFSQPVTTLSGEKATSIVIGKGTMVTVPISALNRSPLLWGLDAAEFRPGVGWSLAIARRQEAVMEEVAVRKEEVERSELRKV